MAETTGQVAQSYDQREASGNADAIVAVGTIALIVLLLLVIFRSPLIALLPVVVIGVVPGVANGLIADLNKGVGMQADSSISSLLIVVLFGVKRGMVNAVTRVGEAIASAAGVVIIAFRAMTLSSLGVDRSRTPNRSPLRCPGCRRKSRDRARAPHECPLILRLTQGGARTSVLPSLSGRRRSSYTS